MPFRDLWLLFQDLLDAIDQIDGFVAGLEFEAFQADPKTTAAVERKLLVISEAAIRLGDEAETLCPDLPWRNIRGLGNWLRHQHDAVDPEAVWLTVLDDLPPLQAAVRQTLAKRSSK